MNYYKHHINDYAAATVHLTWDEDMAYTRLIRTYYQNERPLPVDISEVCRLVRATKPTQKRAVASILNEFFELLDDGWHQRRCDTEILLKQERAEHNRIVGELGGRPPKSKTQPVSKNNPRGNGADEKQKPKRNPSHKPLASNIEREGNATETFPHTEPTEEYAEPEHLASSTVSDEPESRVIESNEDRERRLTEGFTYPHDRYPEARGPMKPILDAIAERRDQFLVKLPEIRMYRKLLDAWGSDAIMRALDLMPAHWACIGDQLPRALIAQRDGQPIKERSTPQNSNGRQDYTNGTTQTNRQPSEQYRRATRQPTAEDFAVAYAVNVNPTSIEDSG